MPLVKRNMALKQGDSDGGLPPQIAHPALEIAVVVRQQTDDEQHRFKAATDMLLMELVRQQLNRKS